MSEHFEEPDDFDDTEPVVDPWDYTPPKVEWVPIKTRTGNVTTLPTGEQIDEEKVTGFRVEPPFGTTWPPLQTLRHFAALIEHRTGLKVRVAPKIVGREIDPELNGGDDWVDEEHYEVRTDRVAGQAAPYEVAYGWLSGFENGVYALLWNMSSDSK